LAKWKRGDRCPAEKMHNTQFLIKESIGVSDFVFILVNANNTEGIYLTYPLGCFHSEWSHLLSITSLLSSSVCDSQYVTVGFLLSFCFVGGKGVSMRYRSRDFNNYLLQFPELSLRHTYGTSHIQSPWSLCWVQDKDPHMSQYKQEHHLAQNTPEQHITTYINDKDLVFH
jgi:hypothetical protein